MYMLLFLYISLFVVLENLFRIVFVEYVDLSEVLREGFVFNYYSFMLKCVMMIIICVYFV